MPLCSICKKRQAVVFATDTAHPGRTAGYCFTCARKIGLPNIEDMIKQFGLNSEMIEDMEEQMAQAAENGELPFSAMFNEVMPGLEDGEEEYDDDDEYEDEEEGDESDDETEDEQNNAPAPIISSDENNALVESKEEIEKPDDDDSSDDNEGGGLFNPFRNLFGSSFEMGGAQFADGQPKKRKRGKQDSKRRFLEGYCENLTKKAKDGRIDSIIGRDKEINRVIQILCRRSKNNPCLIGEPGVGKTAIAEGLALRIASGEVPLRLANKEIHRLDLTALVAGTQFRGQFESRM